MSSFRSGPPPDVQGLDRELLRLRVVHADAVAASGERGPERKQLQIIRRSAERTTHRIRNLLDVLAVQTEPRHARSGGRASAGSPAERRRRHCSIRQA